MTRSRPSTSPNKLLARLPSADYQRLLPSLATVPLSRRRVLQKQHETAQRIYFPGGGVCSITRMMADGQIVETASVGNEGMIGLTAFFGGDLEPGEALVQVPGGEAQVMDINAFRREIERRGAFYDLINRYAQAFVASLMQSVACNALHPLERRCARWLLETHDRIGRDEFALTQDVLAAMLGVRRASVTLCAGDLHHEGAIDYGHRRIVVRSRAKLEAASCECYAVIKGYFARLFP